MSEQITPTKKESSLEEKKPQQPEQYSVILLNSDYAEFLCVLRSLIHTFRISPEKAMYLTQQAHMHGQICIATYSKDIAETKAEQAYNTLALLHKEINLDPPSAIYQVVPYTDN